MRLINFQIRGDERGSLISLEENRNIPFTVKRIYYIFATKDGVRRGRHAHHSLEQVLICTSGSCKILLDDGENKSTVVLNTSDRGLYIAGLVWHEMYDFSPDCVLMVLADQYYDENEYIRDYDVFLNMTKIKGGCHETTV